MRGGIRAYIDQSAPLIDRALQARVPVSALEGTDALNDALSYAVFSGGKRMRPVLVLLASEVCGATASTALPVACALEFVHAASLALDDLPAMDDADLRRGRPTLHNAFGEDVALLAALGLLNEAYAIFATIPRLFPYAIQEIGANGMIGGQAADVAAARSASRVEKTTALTRLAMAAGAFAAGAAQPDAEALIAFGHAIGEAYQVCDDVADAHDGEADLGKTSGQDLRHRRHSYARQLGPAAACKHARALVDDACDRLRCHFADRAAIDLLDEFARSIISRAFDMETDDATCGRTDGLPVSGRLERGTVAGSLEM